MRRKKKLSLTYGLKKKKKKKKFHWFENITSPQYGLFNGLGSTKFGPGPSPFHIPSQRPIYALPDRVDTRKIQHCHCKQPSFHCRTRKKEREREKSIRHLHPRRILATHTTQHEFSLWQEKNPCRYTLFQLSFTILFYLSQFCPSKIS